MGRTTLVNGLWLAAPCRGRRADACYLQFLQLVGALVDAVAGQPGHAGYGGFGLRAVKCEDGS